MGCRRFLGDGIVAGTGLRFVPRLIPVGLPRSVFAVRRFILSARVGAVAILVVVPLRFWIPFGSLNRWHMGTQGAGIRSPCLRNFISAFASGRGVTLTATGSLSTTLTTAGPLLSIAGIIRGSVALTATGSLSTTLTTVGPLLSIAGILRGSVALTATGSLSTALTAGGGFLCVAALLAVFTGWFAALLSPALRRIGLI